MSLESLQILFRADSQEEKREIKARIAQLGYTMKEYFLTLYQLECQNNLIKPKS